MEEMLQIVLKNYIRDVEDVCDILLKSINHTQTLKLKNKYDFFNYITSCKKTEFEAGGFSFRLHGIGCVAYNERKFMDWDFGYRSRWCGINPWKVSMTLKKSNSPCTEFFDGNLIQMVCEEFVKKGIMFKRYEQYYFEVPEEETFKPEFPEEYDTLVIEYFSSSWSIPRNKMIERFIRKSCRIHKQIEGASDKYMLKFLLNGNEVGVIPYNDTSYPENAVKIMSDVIIKNLSRV